MRILGIDPGIGRMGWGIVEVQGSALRALRFGCLETSARLPFEKRLLAVHEEVSRIIDMEKPDVLSIEDLFFSTNAKTAFSVGQARGVILLAAEQGKVSTVIYTPLQVKVAVTGYGKADKNQVGSMVKALLRLSVLPKPDDINDALAIAITHGVSHRMSKHRK